MSKTYLIALKKDEILFILDALVNAAYTMKGQNDPEWVRKKNSIEASLLVRLEMESVK